MSADLLGHQLDGEGEEVVLLLNGGMMTHRAWAPVVAGLLDSYRVLGCDFRGQLMSPGGAHQRLEDNVGDVVDLLDALDLDAVHVLATSFGGEVGLFLAARHQARVRTLAVVAAVDRSPPGMGENARAVKALARQVLAGGDPGPLHDAMVEEIYAPAYRATHAEELAARRSHTLPAAWYQGLLGILTSIEDFDLSPVLGEIVCPTLVVHAAQDAVMPATRVRALAAAIADSELQIHPSSGHALVAEEPAWLGDRYRDFLHRRAATPGEV